MTVVAATRPYPWPYDERLDGATVALVLAGWDTGWRGRAVAGAADADAACASMAKAVGAIGGAVLAVAHGGGDPLGTPVGGRYVTAAGLDGFYGGALEPVLRGLGRTHLLVAGHGLEGPVHSTLRSANDRGFECLLVADAASALTIDCVDAASSTVCMSGGIFGGVGDVEAVLAALASLPPGGPS